jgi:hypothetical protein
MTTTFAYVIKAFYLCLGVFDNVWAKRCLNQNMFIPGIGSVQPKNKIWGIFLLKTKIAFWVACQLPPVKNTFHSHTGSRSTLLIFIVYILHVVGVI